MISIVMTYLNRQEQLNKTLESFKKYDPKEFNVVVVDDGSPEDIVLPKLSFDVTVVKMYNKTWVQGEPAYNTGLKYALLKNPDIIILQNTECYHHGNILEYAKRVTDETYISFGCYSQGEKEEIGSIINNQGASFDGQSAWYNHPIYRKVEYDFCSAITASNIKRLNGYDERFSFGIGYGDDYLLARIRMLNIKIEITSDPYVIHQWHSHLHLPADAIALVDKNRLLFQTLVANNNPRAEHLITSDL